MPVQLFLLGILVAAGVAASVLLVPGDKELAYMHFKAQNYDLARRDFERMIEGGDFSASVVLPLGELYLVQGEMEKAIKLVESYVGANPWDVSGLKKLADFYRFGQRTAPRIATLEALNERAPTRESLRDLMALHDTQGRVDDHTRVLRALVRQGLGESDDHELLAFRLASVGHAEDARLAIDALRRRYPKAFHDDLAELDLSLALDRGDVAGGFDGARRWVEEFKEIPGTVSLSQVLAARGRADLGLRLLQIVAKEPVRDAALLGALIDLEYAAGRNEQARRRVIAWDASGSLPEARIPSLIDAKLATEGLRAAMAHVERVDAEILPEWLTVGLVERAVRDGQADVAARLVARLGAGLLEARPILAAELAWLRGDRAGFDRWTNDALARPDLALDDKAALARLLVAAKRNDVALRLMRELVLEPATPAALSGDLAELYVALGRQAEGLALFERLKTQRPSPVVEAAWARLAALAGRGAAVIAWLDQAVDPGAQLLEDLFYIAGDTRQRELALAAATRLYAFRPTREVARHLAEALIQIGRPKDALAPLRSLLPGDAALRATYAAALDAAGETEELTRFRARELETLAEDDPRRGEVARLLMDLGAFDRALPVLRQLASEQGGEWIAAYAEAATKAGKPEDAVAFLRAALVRGDLARDIEEATLHALVASAGVAGSLAELRRAADRWGGDWLHAYADAASAAGRGGELADALVEWLGRAGASAQATEARLSLLAERTPERALGFIEDAARRAPDLWADRLIDLLETLKRKPALIAALKRELDRPGLPKAKRDARLFLLIDRGGEAEALPYLAKIARAEGGDWIGAYDTALGKLGRGAERDAFVAAIAREAGRKPEERRQAAFRLLELGRRGDAVSAFRLLAENAAAGSPDVEQLLYLWGPRPAPAELDWIETRARRSAGEDQARWLRRLVDAGAPRRAVAVIESAPGAEQPAVGIYLDALAAARDPAALARAIERASGGRAEPTMLRRLARLVEQEGQSGDAARAYRALLAVAPDDRPALLGAGRAAHALGRRSEAKTYFQRLAETKRDDYESAYLLGEILLAEKKPVEARAMWLRALALVAEATVQPYGMRATEALALHRLGRSDEAVAAFERLREERPKDSGLIGDYANVLLDLGRKDRAAALLASQ